MKRNINLMQANQDLKNPDDINFETSIKEYVLQALANLGQRIGIKGDGILYRNFSFHDLLNNENISYNSKEHIGWLQYKQINYDELIATFGITNINNGEETSLLDINTKNINDILYSDNEFQFTIPINSIEKYSKNSIFSYNEDELTIITVGKLMSYEDDDENNAVLLYYKFDINTNKPIYIAKLGFIDSTNETSYYYALELNSLEDSNEYELNIKIFNSNSIGDVYSNAFKNLFIYSNHNNGEDLSFAFLRKDFIDLNNFKAYNDNLNMNYDSNSPLSVIMNSISDYDYYSSTKLSLYLNTESNEFLYSTDETFRNTISFFKNEYNFIDIEEELYNINNDITDFYRNILLYYNEKFYNGNRKQLIKRILCKLYESVINESNSEYNKMYIPLDYEFSYVCNSNNELNIYWSNDIYVLYSNLNKQLNKTDLLSSQNYVIFDYEEIEKVYSYRFEVEYNKKYENVINNINIRRIYSMPYVDADENWNINGNSTSIRAIGKNAGNPNIIVIYSKNKTDDDSSYEIINNIYNLDFSNEEFIKEKFLVNNSLFNDINNEIYCYAWIPVITESNKELFENSIILNICNLNCLEDLDYKEKYLGSNILTLWYYIYENNEYKFKLIKDNNYAMPFGVTKNLESDNYNTFDQIILNTYINNNIAQETENENDKNYLYIKNKIASKYNTEYKNNLNAILEYTKYLKNNDLYNFKYINDLNSINSSKITNVLYPRKEYILEALEISTETYNNKIVENLKTEEQITIDLSDGKYIVSSKIYDTIENTLVRIKKNGTTEVSVKKLKENEDNQNYWFEYVFNENVPSLDFKEIFIRNINTLNRYNIISLDQNGKSYYGYLGSLYDEEDKSILHLGTLNRNINIGNDTLINDIDNDEFNKFNKLSIDFDNISLNSETSLSSKSYLHTIIRRKIDDIYYYFNVGKYWIIEKLTKIFTYDNQKGKQLCNIIYDLNNNSTNSIKEYIYDDNNEEQIIIKCIDKIDNNDNEIKNYYLISINYILKELFKIDLYEYTNSKIILNSDFNKIIVFNKTINNKENVPTFFLLINDSLTKEIKENKIVWSTDTIDILYNNDIDNISIIIKFDKYNYENTKDNYLTWDNINGLIIYPDENKIPKDILITFDKAWTAQQFINETPGSRIENIKIVIKYNYKVLYENGDTGSLIEGEIINSIGYLDIPIDASSNKICGIINVNNVNITKNIGNYNINKTLLNITVPVEISYTPQNFRILNSRQATINPSRLDADDRNHTINIYKKFDIEIEYKNGFKENDNITGNWTTSVLANKPEGQEYIETTKIINAHTEQLTYRNITKNVNIEQLEVIINPKEDRTRNGYYFYVGDELPNINLQELDLKNVQIVEPGQWGWRYLIDDLTNIDKYDIYFRYDDYNDKIQIINCIYDNPTKNISEDKGDQYEESEDGILYLILPNNVEIRDGLVGLVPFNESIGTFENNTATDNSVTYCKYKFIDEINRNFIFNLHYSSNLNGMNIEPYEIISVTYKNQSLLESTVIANGEPKTIIRDVTFNVKAKYQDGSNYIYNVEKTIEIEDIIQTNNLTTGSEIYNIPDKNINNFKFGNLTKNNINIIIPGTTVTGISPNN